MRMMVTVEEAISKARRTIFYPMLLIFLGAIVGAIILVAQYHITTWIIAIGFVVGFVTSWVYWSFAITHWRIWAFENVRNVQELKRKAILYNIIKEDGTFSNRTEIRSRAQKQKLQDLERKFSVKDIYRDDFNIPKETRIKSGYIGNGIVAGTGFLMFVMITRLLLASANKMDYRLLVPLLLGGLLSFFGVKELLSKEPRLVLNAEGIKLAKKNLMEWHHITNDFVVPRLKMDTIKHYLIFDYKDKPVELLISGLELQPNEIENLLRVYRIRFERNHPV
ncbi:hypothetical protein [Flavobacterium sp. XGLA_31]|uniref:hypothetical protein n=1 Tax=Flavobacterium sp. XGLA_31 TaxID=3447666 RepID=UPI003F400172